MPILFQYLLKLSFSLAIMYLFYQFVLRRLTFYNHNRWYLAGYSLLCFLISFINISPILEKNEVARHEIVTFIPAVEALTTKVSPAPAMAEALGGWTVWNWLFVFLIAGAGILLFRLILQLVSFKRLTGKAKLIADDEIKFYQVNENIIPFSFGNSIFINQHLHTEAELKEIIRHEFVHVKQRHTVDIVWSEILCILNWYNPFAWLIRKAMRQNLEFIADNKVVENGMDKKQYQYLLLKVIGNNHFSIASNFNFSSLKKRIAMMNKIRSTKVHLIKFLFVLPLAAILLLSFREVLSSDNKDITGRFNLIDTIPAIDDIKRDSLVSEFLKRNTDIENVGWVYDNVWNNKIVKIHILKKSGANEVYDVKDKSEMSEFEKKYGIYDDLLELNLIRKEGDWTKQDASPGESNVKHKLIDASLNGPSNPRIRIHDKEEPLIIVNGIQWPEGLGVNIMDANKIDSIHIWKNEKAITMYGEKGKNGVIIITPKKQATDNPQTGAIRIKGEAVNAVYYVNGKETSKEAIELIDPAKIQSIDVLKGDKAKEKYGEKGKNGVIEITVPVSSTINFSKRPVTPAWDIKNVLPGKKDEC